MPPTQILISAGESSGDMYAARLATALRARLNVDLFGMGGPRMRDAGIDLVADCSEISLVGIVEIAKKYPALQRVWNRLLGEA
ncbi:MAG: lipid-A-disaccharide synthase, partial [Bryobacteraceae bacterium]